MRRLRLVPVAAAMCLVIACGADVEADAPDAPGTGPSETPEPVTELFDGKVALKLEVPEESALGEQVPMRVWAENISSRTVRVYHGYPKFSFRVSTPDGERVWDWTAGRVFPMPLYMPDMTPGEVWEFEYEWEQHHSDCDGPPIGIPCPGDPVEPGEYIVVGVFHGDVVDPPGNWTYETEGHSLVIRP